MTEGAWPLGHGLRGLSLGTWIWGLGTGVGAGPGVRLRRSWGPRLWVVRGGVLEVCGRAKTSGLGLEGSCVEAGKTKSPGTRVSGLLAALDLICGADGARTRDLRRDRPAL